MQITIRFYEELNDFLPRTLRKQELSVPFHGRRTVKDLIESMGVPHVEIDLVLVNGVSVSLDTLIHDGDRLSVYPLFESFDISDLQHVNMRPLREPKFIVDDNVARLTQLMRMLGFDTYYQKGLPDAQIARISSGEQRTILTRDRGLLKRKEVTHGIYIRSTRPLEQARQVVERLQLHGICRPFARCLSCNELLLPVAEDDVQALDKIPDDVKLWSREFFYCARCQKTYWKGSHFAAMEASIQQILARKAIKILDSDRKGRPPVD